MQCKKICRIAIIVAAASLLLSLSALAAANPLQVYSVPGHPLALTVQNRKGIIEEAWLRSPAGLHPLKILQGKRITDSTWCLPIADNDICADLIWKLSFTDPDTTKSYFLWITALTETPRAWLAVTPAGRSRWDSLPLHLTIPDDVFLYMSPTLPAYAELGDLEQNKLPLLTFVYTVGLTLDGPNFVLVPEVYRQLLPIADLVRKAEINSTIRSCYDRLYDDFEKMGKGQSPSREAIINFNWKKVLSINWQN